MNIVNITILTLKELLLKQQTLLSTAKGTAKNEAQARIDKLSGAVAGWQTLIDYRNSLDVKAANGALLPVKNLVPEALINDSKGDDSVFYINGTKAANANAIREIAAFSFVGGGSKIAYVESGSRSDSSSTSSRSVFEIDARARFFASEKFVVIGIEANAEIGYARSESSTHTNGSKSEVEATRSFILGDPDEGDSFDIQVRIS